MGPSDRKHDERSSARMETPDEKMFTGALDDDSSDTEIPPKQFGRFLIKRAIGRGGMGIVYLAEQTEPFRRDVALKFIRRGSIGDGVIQRFNLERQAHAVMNHENIARVYDADATEDGQPYFVMEYVPGMRLDTYCDDKRLTIAQRLALFVKVCDAVQHAHQKGIIHRDLKPSNILVMEGDDGKPIPKVIDFGVVKPIDPSISGESLHTEQGKLMGTPSYMSPEQLSMGKEDVDTRADVYALGVLLFEVLTGALPYADKWDNVYQYIVNVRKTDAPLASQKARAEDHASVASNRGLDKDALVRALAGDLDWILVKALARDREERYPTAAALAEDLTAYLQHRPISTGRPTMTYIVKKFVQRHRLAVGASFAFVALLVLGLIVTSVSLVRTQRAETEARQQKAVAVDARQHAEASEKRAQAVNTFLTDMLSSADPSEGDKDVRVVDVLAEASDRIDGNFEDPAVVVAVRRTIGHTYIGLGRYEEADAEVRSALETARAQLPESHPETLGALEDLATVHFYRGRYDDAESLFRELVELSRNAYGALDQRTCRFENGLGLVLKFQGKLDEAVANYRDAYECRKQLLGEDDFATLESMNNLAMALKRPDQWREAETLMREVFHKVRRLRGEDHPWTLSTLNNLAHLLVERGDYREALTFHREAYARRVRVLGEDHPQTLQSLDAMAQCLVVLGDTEQALDHAMVANRGLTRVLRPDHPDVLKSSICLTGFEVDEGHLDAAVGRLRTLIPKVEDEFGLASARAIQTRLHLVAAHLFLGDPKSAREALIHVESLASSAESTEPWLPAVLAGYRGAIRIVAGERDAGYSELTTALDELASTIDGSERHTMRLVRLAAHYEDENGMAQKAWDRLRAYDARWPQPRTQAASIRGI